LLTHRQGLDEDLHATAQAQHQVQGALLLDVVVAQRAAVLQLLAREDQALLVGGDALLVLDLLLHVLDRVRGLHVQRDSLALMCQTPSMELSQKGRSRISSYAP
jgi:hypothetical protein